MKAFIVIILVVGALIGGLLTLRSSRSVGMPGKDVLDRARERERLEAARDAAEDDPSDR
jgi:hypothetical protein